MDIPLNHGKLKWISIILFMVLISVSCPLYANTPYYDIKDNYQWMENEQERLTNWIVEISEQSVDILDALPWRKSILQRIDDINTTTPSQRKLIKIVDDTASQFYLRSTSDHPYWRLYIKKPLQNEEVLISPPLNNRISFTVPSADDQFIVYGFAENDSEFSTLRIHHVDSNTDLTETISRIRYPYITWRADNRSFFYSRLPTIEENSDPTNLMDSKIYLHKIGNDFSKDDMVFGIGMDSIKEITATDTLSIDTTYDSSWIIASISPSISGYSSSIYTVRESDLNGNKTKWNKIFDKSDHVEYSLLLSSQLYLAKKNSTSGYSISRLSLDDLAKTEQRLLEWSHGDLVTMNASADSLYVVYHSAGKCHFVRIPFTDARKIETVPMPFEGEINTVFSTINSENILFQIENWTTEPKIFKYLPEKGVIEETQLITSSNFDFSAYVVDEKKVKAQDGTLVPLTIIHKRDIELNSSHPVWLTGYGAYADSILPMFNPSHLVWLEQGGVIAIAHVRGGGELGPDWHNAGRGVKKINSITDFIDCADYLVKNNYTQPNYLVASGRSAGGILVGMAVALRPELFSAIAIDMGILNTARIGSIPIGLMNEEEFGSSMTPDGLRHLQSIDPYLSVQKGIKYPATLLSVGLNDNRVSVWQSAKYAAKLQEIDRLNPVMLVAYSDAGHFFDSSDLLADKISFFLWRIKHPDKF